MAVRKGFTLTELIVVIVIVGISAAFAIPKFIASIEQTKAQAAKNNLLAISASEQKYFEDNASYCTITTGATIPCGDSLAHLNTYLHLGISGNDPYTYSCAIAPAPYTCTAILGTVTLNTSGSGVNCVSGGSYCPN
jgi:prepilin-type N-terminal cleavage/methylation domain-containing protein